MSNKNYNPYLHLGLQFKDGLDYIIANIPPPYDTLKLEQLNDTLIAYFTTLLDSSDPLPFFINNSVLSLLPNAANSYQNNNLGGESFYNEEQQLLIESIFAALKINDTEGIPAVLDDVDDQIAQSGLSAADQSPLFLAVEIGRRSYSYWLENIYDPASPWGDLLNENTAINVANLPFLVSTSIEGALSGFAQIQQLDMGVSTVLNTVGRSFAVTAGMLTAVGLNSGKILFKWVKRVNLPKLSLNKEVMSVLNTDFTNRLVDDDGRSNRPRSRCRTGCPRRCPGWSKNDQSCFSYCICDRN